jgi:hypothetical protein
MIAFFRLFPHSLSLFQRQMVRVSRRKYRSCGMKRVSPFGLAAEGANLLFAFLRRLTFSHFAKKFRNDIDKRPFFQVERPFIFRWFFLEITYRQNTFGLAVHQDFGGLSPRRLFEIIRFVFLTFKNNLHTSILRILPTSRDEFHNIMDFFLTGSIFFITQETNNRIETAYFFNPLTKKGFLLPQNFHCMLPLFSFLPELLLHEVEFRIKLLYSLFRRVGNFSYCFFYLFAFEFILNLNRIVIQEWLRCLLKENLLFCFALLIHNIL